MTQPVDECWNVHHAAFAVAAKADSAERDAIAQRIEQAIVNRERPRAEYGR